MGKIWGKKSIFPEDEFGKLLFDEWDGVEWNKYYSFIFRCVNLYLKEGLIKIKYDKTKDNYNALRLEKMFHRNNSKKLINHYLKTIKNNQFTYCQTSRHWCKIN